MIYRIRRIKLDNAAEICWRAKRCETYLTMQDLRIGGIAVITGDDFGTNRKVIGRIGQVERLCNCLESKES